MATNLIDQAKNNVGIQVSPCDDFGEGVVQAASSITPGMVVDQGTLVGDLIPGAGAGLQSGIALENQNITLGTVTNPRDAFAAGQRVRYGREPGFKFMGLVASGESLVKGDLLTASAGKLVKFTTGNAVDQTQVPCARYIGEAATGTLGADTYLLCKWGVSA